MNLSLLAPLALAGAALVAVPVLLHLIDQRKVPIQDLPTLRFLRQAQKRLRRQSKVRDRWLLLVRILGLLALVLAAAAPLLTYEEDIPAGAELAPNVVFLLDRSMSMGYAIDDDATVLDAAVDQLEKVVAAMPEGTRVGLVRFDRWPEDVVGGLVPDKRRVLDAARQTEVGYAETDLRAAILAGVRALLATPEGGGDLYLLTDLTDASLPGDRALELPEQLEGRVRLVVPRLDERQRDNRSLVGATVSGGAVDDAPIKVVARVRGEGAPGEATLDLFLGEASVSRGFVNPEVGAEIDKPFSLPLDAEHTGPASLILAPDALPADDAWYFRLSQRRQLRVLIIDGQPGMNLATGESYFLERALNPSTGATSRITPVVTGPGGAATQNFADFSVIFLSNVADPSPLVARLSTFVEAGGGLFISAGDNLTAERYNRSLRGLLPASLGETIAAAPDVTGEKAPSLGFPPVGHPVFRIFREAGASVFGTTHFYRVVPTSPSMKGDAEVLLKFSSGLPALLGRKVGRGRVFFFASSLDRAWNDLPLKSIFLPFIQESVHYLAGNPAAEGGDTDLRVGQVATVLVPSTTGPLYVLSPDGETTLMETLGEDSGDSGGSPVSRRALRAPQTPGHYQVFEEVQGQAERQPRDDLAFAVNVPESETHLGPLDVERLKAAVPGVPTVFEGLGDQTEAMVTVERKRRLSHPLLWVLLGLLIVEGIMTVRRHGKQGEDPTQTPRSPAVDTGGPAAAA